MRERKTVDYTGVRIGTNTPAWFKAKQNAGDHTSADELGSDDENAGHKPNKALFRDSQPLQQVQHSKASDKQARSEKGGFKSTGPDKPGDEQQPDQKLNSKASHKSKGSTAAAEKHAAAALDTHDNSHKAANRKRKSSDSQPGQPSKEDALQALADAADQEQRKHGASKAAKKQRKGGSPADDPACRAEEAPGKDVAQLPGASKKKRDSKAHQAPEEEHATATGSQGSKGGLKSLEEVAREQQQLAEEAKQKHSRKGAADTDSRRKSDPGKSTSQATKHHSSSDVPEAGATQKSGASGSGPTGNSSKPNAQEDAGKPRRKSAGDVPPAAVTEPAQSSKGQDSGRAGAKGAKATGKPTSSSGSQPAPTNSGPQNSGKQAAPAEPAVVSQGKATGVPRETSKARPSAGNPGAGAAVQKSRGSSQGDQPQGAEEEGGQVEAEPPEVAALLAPLPKASQPDTKAYMMLHERYTALQGHYRHLKSQKISDLEGLLEEQEAYVTAMSEAAHRLADHWREEAEKQAELNRAAGAAETLDRLSALEAENLDLKRSRVDQELVVTQLNRTIVDLRLRLQEAQARADAAVAQQEAAEQQLTLLTAAPVPVSPVPGTTPAPASTAAAGISPMEGAAGPARAAAATPAATLMLDASQRTVALQCPTPAPPSPGVACQFPSPLVAAAADGLQPAAPTGNAIAAGAATPCVSSSVLAVQPTPAQGRATPTEVAAMGITAHGVTPGASKGREAGGAGSHSIHRPHAPATTNRRLSVAGGRRQGLGVADSTGDGDEQEVQGPGLGGSGQDQAAATTTGAGSRSVNPKRVGSPVDGLCTAAQHESRGAGASYAIACGGGPAITELGSMGEWLPRALAPEGAQDSAAPAPAAGAEEVIDLNPASAQKRAGYRRSSIGPAAAPSMDRGRRLTMQPQYQQLRSLVEEQEEEHQPAQTQQQASARRASLAVPAQNEQAEQHSLSKGMQQLVQAVQATTASMAAAVAGAAGHAQQPQALLHLPSEDAGPGQGPANHSPQLSIQGSTSVCAEGGVLPPGVSPDAAAELPLGAAASGAAAAAGWPAKTPGRPLGQAPPAGSVPSMTPSLTPKMARLQTGVFQLFGFEVRPLSVEGAYEYRHPATGLRFQIRPAALGTAGQQGTGHEAAGGQQHAGEMDSELDDVVAPGAAYVEYVLVAVGSACLPPHLQESITFDESQKPKFVTQLWKGLASVR